MAPAHPGACLSLFHTVDREIKTAPALLPHIHLHDICAAITAANKCEE
jgi:hypothetical protein